MSDSDWQVGDLALCVAAGPIQTGRGMTARTSLREGAAYAVSRVSIDPLDGETVLGLAGCHSGDVPTGGSYSCQRFLKIRPDKHESCEDEFVELLNRIKRKAPTQ